jgi:putative acetyltransferase
MTITLRPYEPTDADDCLSLFHDTIHRVNLGDYSKAQVDAWASLAIDLPSWSRRFDGRFAYVAAEGGRIVGFTDMTRDGHLDRLFVSADHQRRGIGRRLVEKILRDARAIDVVQITTDASLTAKPFFEGLGFETICQQTVDCRGVKMTNFKMRRPVDLP